jgi:transglutaminase-like putative cysteine protease
MKRWFRNLHKESVMKSLNCRALMLLLLLSISCSAASSALASKVEPDLMQKLSTAGGLEKFTQANLVFVEKRREIRYEMDGTYLDRNYLLIKVLTEPAIGYFAAMPAYEYYSYRSEVNIQFAHIIKRDGTLIEVPAEMITDLVNPMYSQLNVNDSTMRLKQIAFTNLQVGDAVEYAIEEKCTRPVSPDFELKEGKYLQEDEPALYTRIEINGPEGKPLNSLVKCAEKLNIQFSTTKKDGRATYLWEARDIPPFLSEPGWNTRQHFAARLLASTICSWREISRTSYQINQPSIDENDSLRTLVTELTRNLKSDEEKIQSILCYLRKNISYRGMTSVSAYKGKPATQTLADRFGVCRDVAVLMCSMLKVAGIESYPAATGYGRVFDKEVPHDIFQHMIVAVPDQKGRYRLYDPTVALYRQTRCQAMLENHHCWCANLGEKISKKFHPSRLMKIWGRSRPKAKLMRTAG